MRATFKLGFASAILALSTVISAGSAVADSRMFFAYLYGGNEVPVTGDANAYGIATVLISTPTQICYSILLKDAAVATVAHIHTGVAGVAGPILVPLNVSTAQPARNANCTTVAAATVTAIQDNPQNHYVNVHNGDFPGGAARGQLQ